MSLCIHDENDYAEEDDNSQDSNENNELFVSVGNDIIKFFSQ